MAKSKHKPTPAEIANDPSLKYHCYQWGEVLLSDDTGGDVRFLRYENGLIRVATVLGIGEIPQLFDPLRIRRHTLNPTADLTDDERKQALAEIVSKKMLARNNSTI